MTMCERVRFFEATMLCVNAYILVNVFWNYPNLVWPLMVATASFLLKVQSIVPIYTIGKFTKAATKTTTASGGVGSSTDGIKKDGTPKIKIPRGRDSAGATVGVKKTETTKTKLPATAPIEMCVCRYTNAASIFIQRFPAMPLFMITVRHRARPGITWQLNRAMNACIQRIAAGENENQFPGTWAELQATWNVKTCFKPQNDPDNLGYAQDLVTFYVAGDIEHLENFIALLDTFFNDRRHFPEAGELFPEELTVELYPHDTVDLTENLAGRMDITTTVHPKAPRTPIDFYKGSPPFTGQHLIVNFTFEEDQLDSTLTGNLYPFYSIMSTNEIRGEYYGPENESGRQTLYCRYLPDVDVTDEGQMDGLIRILTDVMHKQIILARVATEPAEDTPAFAAKTRLKTIPNLYFEE